MKKKTDKKISVSVGIKKAFSEVAQKRDYSSSPELQQLQKVLRAHGASLTPVFPEQTAENNRRGMFMASVGRKKAAGFIADLKKTPAVSYAEVPSERKPA